MTNFFHRLDVWLGKNLFHPPIILVCQLTRQSQYAVHRALWFFAVCHATYYAMAKGAGWGWTIFLWIWVSMTFASAAFFPDRPTRSSGYMRFLFGAMFAIGVLSLPITGRVSDAMVRELVILFAEYAATIKTIPPRKTRERSAKGKEAKA